MTLFREALKEGTARLEMAGIDTARLDAELLLSYACKINRAKLLARLNDEAPDDKLNFFIVI